MKTTFLSVWIAVLMVANLAAQRDIPPELIQYPNLILNNGKILTVDEDFRTAEAVAIRDGVFLAVGTNQEIQRLRGPETHIIDLEGKTVIPGFVATDADNDFVGGNLYKETLIGRKIYGTLRGLIERDDILQEIEQRVAPRPAGERVFFRLPEESADAINLTLADLDPVTPNHPIAISITSADMVVNSLMLDDLVASMPGGEKHPAIIKDPQTGKPTGQIYGQATGIV